MAEPQELQTAAQGDAIAGADLQDSIDNLRALAVSLDARIDDAPDVATVQAIGRAQADLRGKAADLVDAQIDLMAGEAKITAEHINAATKFALDTIRQIAEWRKAAAAVGKVVDFVGSVLTGNGKAILTSALALKSVLT